VGFDGRTTGDTKFWNHNTDTQYGDLMHTIEKSHPGFFFFRNYEDYYDRHCSLIEKDIYNMERDGWKVVSLTESAVPALEKRFAKRNVA
jgi:hypothetical protein